MSTLARCLIGDTVTVWRQGFDAGARQKPPPLRQPLKGTAMDGQASLRSSHANAAAMIS